MLLMKFGILSEQTRMVTLCHKEFICGMPSLIYCKYLLQQVATVGVVEKGQLL
jgi:hypothetical protein